MYWLQEENTHFFGNYLKKGMEVKEVSKACGSLLFHCLTKFMKVFLGRNVQIWAGPGTLKYFPIVSIQHLLKFKPGSSRIYWNVCRLTVILWTEGKGINPILSWLTCSAWKIEKMGMREIYNENGKTSQALENPQWPMEPCGHQKRSAPLKVKCHAEAHV